MPRRVAGCGLNDHRIVAEHIVIAVQLDRLGVLELVIISKPWCLPQGIRKT